MPIYVVENDRHTCDTEPGAYYCHKGGWQRLFGSNVAWVFKCYKPDPSSLPVPFDCTVVSNSQTQQKVELGRNLK